MKIIIHWIVSALAIWVTAYLLHGVHIDTVLTALVLAVVLGFINAFIRPILVVLTLPLSIVTLGFFTLILNALLILLATTIVPGFIVDSFWWAFLFGIALALVNAVFRIFELR